MNHDRDPEMQALLKKAFPPVETELPRDLWPAMLRRLESRSIVTPWYDWALALVVAVVFMFFPQWILLLAYHL